MLCYLPIVCSTDLEPVSQKQKEPKGSRSYSPIDSRLNIPFESDSFWGQLHVDGVWSVCRHVPTITHSGLTVAECTRGFHKGSVSTTSGLQREALHDVSGLFSWDRRRSFREGLFYVSPFGVCVGDSRCIELVCIVKARPLLPPSSPPPPPNKTKKKREKKKEKAMLCYQLCVCFTFFAQEVS